MTKGKRSDRGYWGRGGTKAREWMESGKRMRDPDGEVGRIGRVGFRKKRTSRSAKASGGKKWVYRCGRRLR